MRPSLSLALSLLTATVACGNNPSTTAADAGPDAASLVAARPYTLVVPASYDKSKPTPLLIMMHGYGVDGSLEDAYMQLTPLAQAHGFLYAYGDGTLDPKTGARFWNATDACCDRNGIPVDDVAYINAIREDVSRKYNVDAKRLFLLGHSNGGFMAHRYACDHADQVAAIVSLAGGVWKDASRCQASEPVAIAEVHGDQDSVIAYDGGTFTDSTGKVNAYPSAHQTVAIWAAKDACAQALADSGTLSLDTALPAGSTQVERYGACARSSDVELWTIHGGPHIPPLDTSWGESVWAFLSAHPKP
jgi:polyhydroxybutyrate depolymerase